MWKLCNNHKRTTMQTLIFTSQHQVTCNNCFPNSSIKIDTFKLIHSYNCHCKHYAWKVYFIHNCISSLKTFKNRGYYKQHSIIRQHFVNCRYQWLLFSLLHKWMIKMTFVVVYLIYAQAISNTAQNYCYHAWMWDGK